MGGHKCSSAPICALSRKKQLQSGHEHRSTQGVVDGEAGVRIGIKKEGCYPLAARLAQQSSFEYLILPRPRAGTDKNLLVEGALSDTGVDGRFRKSCRCFYFRESERFILQIFDDYLLVIGLLQIKNGNL